MRADNRGEGGILALLALVRPSGTPTGLGPAARGGRAVRRGAALRRRHHHARDLGARRGGGPQRRHARAGSTWWCRSRSSSSSRCSSSSGAARRGSARSSGRSPRCGSSASPPWVSRGSCGNPRCSGPSIRGTRWISSCGKGAPGFMVLGAVILVVTGGEALYADMGHFGKRPIRLAWFALVLPALVLNYFGQGALLLDDPAAAGTRSIPWCPAGRCIRWWARDGGRGRRVAGADLRGVLAHPAGRPAGLLSAGQHRAHLEDRDRTDLRPGGQQPPDGGLPGAGRRLPLVGQPRGHVRRGAVGDDDDHDHPVRRRGPPALGLERVEGRRADRRCSWWWTSHSSAPTCSRSRTAAGSRWWSRAWSTP